jgi:hypothetical protein
MLLTGLLMWKGHLFWKLFPKRTPEAQMAK